MATLKENQCCEIIGDGGNIGGGGGGTPGGTDGQIQYNNSGSFGGFANWDGTDITFPSDTNAININKIQAIDSSGLEIWGNSGGGLSVGDADFYFSFGGDIQGLLELEDIQARDNTGLSIYDVGGANGIELADGGDVTFTDAITVADNSTFQGKLQINTNNFGGTDALVVNGTGSIPTLQVDTGTPRVGIHIASPLSDLHVFSDAGLSGNSVGLTIEANGDPKIRFKASTVTNSWYIDFDNQWADRLTFTESEIARNNRSCLLMDRAASDYKVGINQPAASGSITIGAQLHIIQSNTSGAFPVLRLDQDDVSEEFVRYVGEAASGVLTQSIVNDDDVTTATLAGWVKVYVQDDGNQITDQAYYQPIYTLT